MTNSALLTARQVAAQLSISRVHVWRKVSDGTLPAPVYVGPKAPRWRAEDIAAWIEALPGRPAAA